MVNRTYRASKSQSKRPGWSVSFRHPRRTDTRGKYGLRVRHGLGTDDAVEADELVEQLNELLAEEGWWSADRRADAERRFDSRIVSIFFDRIEVGEVDPKGLRGATYQATVQRGRICQGDVGGNNRGGQDHPASPSHWVRPCP